MGSDLTETLLLWLGEDDPVVRALAYAAAVVVSGQLVVAAINVHQFSQSGLQGIDRTEAVVHALAVDLGQLAFEAGLLVAAAALLSARRRAARAGGTARPARPRRSSGA